MRAVDAAVEASVRSGMVFHHPRLYFAQCRTAYCSIGASMASQVGVRGPCDMPPFVRAMRARVGMHVDVRIFICAVCAV